MWEFFCKRKSEKLTNTNKEGKYAKSSLVDVVVDRGGRAGDGSFLSFFF